ncbi:DMT family transporter [Candidatus Sumerlaeota bacterium]|nr:DMT family transporter [Candidatus Sumerlaeota bacterium]
MITTILLWSSAFPLIRVANHGYNPMEIAFGRYGLASLILLVVALVMRIRLPRREHLVQLFISGFFSVTVYNVALNWGMQRLIAGPASFVVNTLPMFTAILSTIFLKEKILPAGWLGLIISCSGILLIAIGESGAAILNVGTFSILLAALSWAISIIQQKPLLKFYAPLEIVCYSIWSGALCMAFVLPSLVASVKTAPMASTSALVYLGVFPAVVAYITWNMVLAVTPAARAASFLYLVPVLSTAIAFFLLKEVPTRLTLVGGALALGGVIVINALGRQKTNIPEKRIPEAESTSALHVHE